MASNRTYANEQLQAMSELRDFKIESGDTDPRGWSVVGRDGQQIGRVADLLVDTAAMKVRSLLVDPTDAAGNSRITLEVSDVDLRPDTRQVIARAYDGAGFDPRSASQYTEAYAGAAQSEKRLTRTEEELAIGKREVSRGEARISKHVETEHVSEPVTRRREEVVIERRPVEPGRRAEAASIEDAEVRIPLMEEEVIVEKHPVVKEELVIGKRVVEERDTVEADVRREEFDIENPAEGSARDRTTERTDRR